MDSTEMGNSTESPPFEFSDYTQRVIVAVIYLIVILLGTVGNVLVILAMSLSKKLRTATNIFVVNLSIGDLLTCLALPWTVATTLSKNGLPFNTWVCSLAAAIQATAIGCSMYTLAFIGLQRLLLIKWRASAYRIIYTPRKIVAWLVVTWSIPLLLTLIPPLADVGEIGYNKKYHHCGFPSTHPRSGDYDLIIALGFYPLPFLILILCYASIWRHLCHVVKSTKHPKASAELSMGESVATENSPSGKPAPVRRGTLRRSQMSRHQTKVTKNMFYIVCAFTLCLIPFGICLLVNGTEPFLPYAYAILVFNSCVNPLIYASKHHDFKSVFCCILRCKWDNIPEPSDFLKRLISNKVNKPSISTRSSAEKPFHVAVPERTDTPVTE